MDQSFDHKIQKIFTKATREDALRREDLEDYLQRPINSDCLDFPLTLSQFAEAFNQHLAALKSNRSHQEAHIEALEAERLEYMDAYDEAVANEDFTDEGINRNSQFDLVVIQARDLTNSGAPPSAFFVLRSEELEVYRSETVADTAHPV